jgi:hypothetical protein
MTCQIFRAVILGCPGSTPYSPQTSGAASTVLYYREQKGESGILIMCVRRTLLNTKITSISLSIRIGPIAHLSLLPSSCLLAIYRTMSPANKNQDYSSFSVALKQPLVS